MSNMKIPEQVQAEVAQLEARLKLASAKAAKEQLLLLQIALTKYSLVPSKTLPKFKK